MEFVEIRENSWLNFSGFSVLSGKIVYIRGNPWLSIFKFP